MSGLRRPLLRDQLCDFCMVYIGFLLIKLSFNVRSRSILPYRGSGNIFENAGQKDLPRLWSLSNDAGQISLSSFPGPFKQIGYAIQSSLEISKRGHLHLSFASSMILKYHTSHQGVAGLMPGLGLITYHL